MVIPCYVKCQMQQCSECSGCTLTPCCQQDSAGEPLYKLFRAIKHQIEKGPVDARVKKAKYTLNDTGLLGDDVEYCVLVSDATPLPQLPRQPLLLLLCSSESVLTAFSLTALIAIMCRIHEPFYLFYTVPTLYQFKTLFVTLYCACLHCSNSRTFLSRYTVPTYTVAIHVLTQCI